MHLGERHVLPRTGWSYRELAGVAAIIFTASSSAALSAPVVYVDTLLGSGVSVVSAGVTMSASASAGGVLGNIDSGTFTGLWVGQGIASTGVYELAFSEMIESILIEFDAMSSTGGLPVETMTAFATNNGPAAISFTPQSGTSFDGTTISTSVNDGQGIIEFSGPAFSSFIFQHDQNPAQNGLVIERIEIELAGMSVIPLPGALPLLASGLAGLLVLNRRRREA